MTIRIQKIKSSINGEESQINASRRLLRADWIPGKRGTGMSFTHVYFNIHEYTPPIILGIDKKYNEKTHRIEFHIQNITIRTEFYTDQYYFHRFEAYFNVCKANMELYPPRPF